MKWFLFLFLCLPLQSLHAGTYFDFNTAARQIYREALSLRFVEARRHLAEFQGREPENLIGMFVENYIVVLEILVDDDKQAFKRLSGSADARLDRISTGPRQSPWNLYCQAEMRLQWAVLRMRFGDQLASLSDVKQAYALLEENQRRFPDFVANKKSLGILHALAGNVPEEYRWALRLASGMEGSVAQGLSELNVVLQYARYHDFPFEEEALVAVAMLQLHLNNQDAVAWNSLKNSKLDPTDSPLAAYAMASIALRSGRTDEAIQLLQKSPSGGAYHPFHYRNYLLGIAKLYRLDRDANVPLQDFLNRFRGKNAVKEAYQKLAWYHLIHGNEGGYRTYMEFVGISGIDLSDPDKAAQREAASGEMPDPELLKARLLFDGGYYSKAAAQLAGKAPAYAGRPRFQLEYTYRSGRIAQKLGNKTEAINAYRQTIEAGAKAPWYFACNAALQLGLLYENDKDYPNAREAYKRCLSLHPEEYAGSLHARAKAGLSRVKD